jgi:hypothetical protein
VKEKVGEEKQLRKREREKKGGEAIDENEKSREEKL